MFAVKQDKDFWHVCQKQLKSCESSCCEVSNVKEDLEICKGFRDSL